MLSRTLNPVARRTRALTLLALAGLALVVFAAPANAYDRGGTPASSFSFTSTSSGDHWPLKGS